MKSAELKGLVWAMSIAIENDQVEVDWRSDAKLVVNQALSATEPQGWDTRNDYLLLRRHLQIPNWSLVWVARETNASADITTKIALKFLAMPAEIVFSAFG